MPIRAPVHPFGVRQSRFILPVYADDVKLQPIGLFAVAAEDDPLAVGRDERPTVVAWRVGKLPHVAAVGIHDVDVGIAISIAGERDLLAIPGVRPLGVVSLFLR